MEFNRLTASFYSDYGSSCPEILKKQTRPYYVAVVCVLGLTFAIPLRSHIHHSKYSFIANGAEAGLDFTKAVVITDKVRYVEPSPTTIRQNEFNMLKQHEYEIVHKFEKFVLAYIKQVRRIQENPRIPLAPWFQYSCLQYFHKELGLPFER
ncbi:MAG: hypothetical protein WCR76_02845 [Sphaerochaetaceae bacterium]|jgi:protein AbiQ